MKPVALSALAGVLLILGVVPASQAVEILRWERLPLPVPLVVGQERVVFIDRNVRVGVPASVGDHLRVQSAGGAIYLRASEPIPPTRLQLQDVESGALILLDIAAEPAKDGQAPLEPVRIVEAEAPAKRYGGGAASGADEQADAPADKSVPRRETPVSVVLTRHAAQNLYAPLRTVEPVAGIGRVNLRRGLALDTLLPTLPVQARALAAWRLEDQWVTAVRLTNTAARWLDLDPRAAGELRGGDLPASEPGSGRHSVRHHGALPGHARPRPGRVAAAGAEPDRCHREPAAGRCGRFDRRSAR